MEPQAAHKVSSVGRRVEIARRWSNGWNRLVVQTNNIIRRLNLLTIICDLSRALPCLLVAGGWPCRLWRLERLLVLGREEILARKMYFGRCERCTEDGLGS